MTRFKSTRQPSHTVDHSKHLLLAREINAFVRIVRVTVTAGWRVYSGWQAGEYTVGGRNPSRTQPVTVREECGRTSHVRVVDLMITITELTGTWGLVSYFYEAGMVLYSVSVNNFSCAPISGELKEDPKDKSLHELAPPQHQL
ncbi:hypothetical protein RRG08_063443 [Elysia crispata]|uniref:Uncharacterized protein n=1 Tax=Elysia crispata TaxID=231223 RepID=A0AAE1DV10_9GAST|nr:hypothetical protein RRG08_063443 [Elysia crispata]